MKSISILEFRRKAKSILASITKGQRLVLTYRGKPVARLEPIGSEASEGEDPFYQLHELAVKDGDTLTNSEMDRSIYGE